MRLLWLCIPLLSGAAGQTSLLWQSHGSYNTDDYDTGVLVATLQGLTNRNTSFSVEDGVSDSKALFVDSFELFNNYVGADRQWINYLQMTKGLAFTNMSNGGLNNLLEALSGVANGVVAYNSDGPDGERYVALTLCGLESLLPVTSRLLAMYPALAVLPVVHDLRGKWENSSAAYVWSLEHLMPRVNQSVGWSGGRSHTGDGGEHIWQGGPPELALLGLDLAVSNQGFMFNLSPNATLAPSEAALFDSVMAGLNGSGTEAASDPKRPLPAIYGWSEPESEFTIRVSRGGGYVLCSGAPNLSFWARLASGSLSKAFGKSARAAAPSPPPRLQKKVYVTFQTNEGDTPKIVAGFFGGSWLNPLRGSVPIAWGINLLLAREFPALMEYYAHTARANDTFFGGTSGAGYAFPSEMPPGAFKRYTMLAQETAAEFVAPPSRGAAPDWTIDIWNWKVPEGKPGPWTSMVDSYANAAPSIGAFTQQTLGVNATTICLGGAGVEGAVNFAPKSLWYPGSANSQARWSGDHPTQASALDDIEERIRATRKPEHSVFTLVYGLIDGGSGPDGLDAVDAAAEMTRRLPPDQFEVIGAQEMARLSRLHCQGLRTPHRP
jgi:hypothetical protein